MYVNIKTISSQSSVHAMSFLACILNKSLNHLVETGALKENTIVYMKEITVDMLDDATNR